MGEKGGIEGKEGGEEWKGDKEDSEAQEKAMCMKFHFK